jgi:DNA-binding NarL/FixJ family response regulator
MDIRMPVLDGLQATRQIVADPDLAGVRVLVLTTFEIDEYVFEALSLGASDRVQLVVLAYETGLARVRGTAT